MKSGIIGKTIHELRLRFDPGYAIGETVMKAFEEAAAEVIKELPPKPGLPPQP